MFIDSRTCSYESKKDYTSTSRVKKISKKPKKNIENLNDQQPISQWIIKK